MKRILLTDSEAIALGAIMRLLEMMKGLRK